MNKLRGVRDIPSSMKLRRSVRVRAQSEYEYEILNELTQLGREKARLCKEKENWQEKIDRINARLSEIEELERSLHRRIAIRENTAPDVQDVPKQAVGKEGREVVIKY
jgi:predicted nuclease with TOPRIM domain